MDPRKLKLELELKIMIMMNGDYNSSALSDAVQCLICRRHHGINKVKLYRHFLRLPYSNLGTPFLHNPRPVNTL